jgi:Cu(I)/Ag(I) efflux system periplasmic protein CusF
MGHSILLTKGSSQMKTSVLLLAAIAALSMSSIPSYAKDEMAMPMPTAKATTHKDIVGKGTVVSENKAGSVTLQHEAIPAIGWGAMTMEFKVKDKMLLDKVKKGDKVQFTLMPQGKDYVITSIK